MKLKRNFSTSKIEKRRKEAQGIGKDYKAFIRVADFPSKGKSHRVFNEKIGRHFELLSKQEYNAYLIFKYNYQIVDFREQYPLFELSETLQIARDLGFKHPAIPSTKYPIIMTTDFLLTKSTPTGIIELARAIKTEEDFNKKRTQEKLKIEAMFWKHRNIDFKVILENSIDPKHLQAVMELERLGELKPNKLPLLDELERWIIANPDIVLDDLFKAFEKSRNLGPGTGEWFYKHLIKEERVKVDLSKGIELEHSYNESQ